jgi:hypothetical protein
MQELPESVREMAGAMYVTLKEGGGSTKGVARLPPNATNAPKGPAVSC